jgi:uncharacterized protein (DUF1684 family)
MPSDYALSWESWHRGREAELASPYGWLSLVGMVWFDGTGELVLPGFPGTWRSDGDQIFYLPDPLLPIHDQSGDAVTTAIQVRAYEDGDQTLLFHGRLRAELVRRGGRHALRLRDPDAPTRRAFAGVPHFTPDPRWAVPARFEAYQTPKRIAVEAIVPGVEHAQEALGLFRFTLEGLDLSLEAVRTSGAGPSVLFRDLTNGQSTYGAGRYLYLHTNDLNGLEVIDFNRAVNPPCAFSSYCTCPLPPPQNHLPVAVTAGETAPTTAH